MKRIVALTLTALLLAALLPLVGVYAASEAPQTDGDCALEFSGVDQNGNTITQAILADKKVVMINYWATWCDPCKEELPALQQLYTEYQDQGFLIIGVLVDGTVAGAQSLIKTYGITYPVIVNNGDLTTLKTSVNVPETAFVDHLGVSMISTNYVGNNSYSGWKTIIVNLLEKANATPSPSPTKIPFRTPTPKPTTEPTATPTPTYTPTPTFTPITTAPAETVTITFVADGETVDSYTIPRGSDLTELPAIPQRSGCIAVWDTDSFKNIQTDLTVTALYYPIEEDETAQRLTNVPPKTLLSTLCTALNTPVAGSDAVVKTGDTIEVSGVRYTVIVTGDVNADGAATAADAAEILRSTVKLVDFTELQKLAANIQGKAAYGTADAALILRYTVRLTTTLGVTEP